MLFFGLTLFSVGLLLLIGAFEKWEWLVDPDKKYWLVYSQALIKRVLGKRFLLYYTYALGIGFTLGGIALLISALLYRS